MKLWYFSSVLPSESTAFRALTARLAVQYGGSFQITLFVPACVNAPCECNGCTVHLFETQTDAMLHNALGSEFALSYEMHLAARKAAEDCGMPDAILFSLKNAAPYYTLLYRYLDSAFWANCPIFIEEEPNTTDDGLPFYLLPHWWIKQQKTFCRMAASGIVGAAPDACPPRRLSEAVCAAQDKPFQPSEFPFLTVRPQSPISATDSIPGMLTVIVPYYNLGKTLPQTLKSAFAIDYPSYEVLLIDDGSSDVDSIVVLHEMETRYPYLRVVRQENHGLSYVRNLGSRLARGEYITFLDADDMVAPDFYRRAIALLEQYKNAAYVSCWFRLFGDAEGYKAYFPSCLPALLLDNMQGPGCVCRRSVFLAYGQNCTDMHKGLEDHEFWINMAEHGYFGLNIPEPLFLYRLSGSSMSAAFSRDPSHYRQTTLFQVLEEKHTALYQEYSTEVYNLLMANGPSYLWPGPASPHAVIGYIEHPPEFWMKEIELARTDAANYANSCSYRLGHFLLHPLRFFKNNSK